MWKYNSPEELYHSGVLGMHWGKRKGISSEDHNRSQYLKTKKLHELSNNELKDLNNRLTLEKNYKTNNPNNIKRGWIAVGATLAIMKTLVELKNNTPQIYNMGKSVVEKLKATDGLKKAYGFIKYKRT